MSEPSEPGAAEEAEIQAVVDEERKTCAAERLEDALDLERARAARARAEKEGTIPFEEVLRELDITL